MGALESEAHRGGANEAAQARLGSLLAAKWQLDGLLGRGGMATVYAATHRATKARVAIKILSPDLAQDEKVRERFLREAHIANSIEHPARVAVLDEGLSELGEMFLVMELLDGQTLDVLMKQTSGGPSLEEKLSFFVPVLELLGECHAAGIVHRDVKPANIFVTRSGQVKVFDFGVARLRESGAVADATKQGTVLGTPAFMAPEQALGLGDQVDGRADLWSVGACIYAFLTGRRVHQARSENESMILAATANAESIAVVAPDLPVEVVAFVDKALAHDRDSRFQGATEMRSALATLLAALRSGQVTSTKGKQGDVVVVRRGGASLTRDDEAAGSREVRARVQESLKAIWRQLAQAIGARRHYGPTHPLALQPLHASLDEIRRALVARPESLTWDVTPYAFSYDGTPLWGEDKAALERISFHLFTRGLRQLQFKEGLTDHELSRFLAVITRDASSGLALTEDAVADLWAQRFEHVAHVAIDSFVSGNGESIDAFEKEADDVAGDILKVSMVTKGFEEHDAGGSLEARALQDNLRASLAAAAEVASSLAVDVSARVALGAQLTLLVDRYTERFIDATASALIEAAVFGDLPLVAAPLGDWSGTVIGRGLAAIAFERFAELGAAVALQATPELAARVEMALAASMFDREKLTAIIKPGSAPSAVPAGASIAPGAKVDKPVASSVIRGLRRVLDLRGDDPFFDLALHEWLADLFGPFSAVLFAYVARWAGAHAGAVAAIIERAPVLQATRLLELFSEAPSDEANAAVAAGLRSTHLEVQRAALRVAREGHQDELLRLLTHPDKDLRREVLAVISTLRSRALGPALVRRIQQPSFRSLDPDEMASLLACLFELNPARAATIATEMLARAPLVPTDANDRSRLVAIEVLAKAQARDALPTIVAAARKAWWNTPSVRQAAEKAVAALTRAPKGEDESS